MTLPDPYFECVESYAAYSICANNIPYPSIFEGKYSDPNHEECPRSIEVSGHEAVVKGADGEDGGDCKNGKTGEAFAVKGKIDGNQIIIDFSPKGGPKDLIGYWNGADLVFEDGNKWHKTMDNLKIRMHQKFLDSQMANDVKVVESRSDCYKFCETIVDDSLKRLCIQ